MEFQPDPPAILRVWSDYKIPIIFGACSVGFLVLSILLLVKTGQSSDPITFSRSETGTGNGSQSATPSADLKLISIDIEGAVGRPGIISIPAGSRVEDVLQSAGGLLRSADLEYVSKNLNRAMKVADGMKFYIPYQQETSHNISTANSETITSHNIDEVSKQADGMSQNIRVSINMASKDQLESLPGVGPVTAQKIIDNRPYGTPQELVTKKAVGSAVYQKIQSFIDL
jgi:competence protein ComEA